MVRKSRSRSRSSGRSYSRSRSSSCPRGTIRRKAYTRKSHSGKTARVPSTCVPDKGAPGKTPKSKQVLPKLKPGRLSQYGYSDVKETSAARRRAALTRAVKKEGYAPIVKRLNVIRTYNKNSPLFSLYDGDLKWVQQHLAPEYSKSYSSSRSGSLSRTRSRRSHSRTRSRRSHRTRSRSSRSRRSRHSSRYRSY